MNLRDVGSETSVNDTVQTNKNDKMLAQRYQKKMLKCNKYIYILKYFLYFLYFYDNRLQP